MNALSFMPVHGISGAFPELVIHYEMAAALDW